MPLSTSSLRQIKSCTVVLELFVNGKRKRTRNTENVLNARRRCKNGPKWPLQRMNPVPDPDEAQAHNKSTFRHKMTSFSFSFPKNILCRNIELFRVHASSFSEHFSLFSSACSFSPAIIRFLPPTPPHPSRFPPHVKSEPHNLNGPCKTIRKRQVSK